MTCAFLHVVTSGFIWYLSFWRWTCWFYTHINFSFVSCYFIIHLILCFYHLLQSRVFICHIFLVFLPLWIFLHVLGCFFLCPFYHLLLPLGQCVPLIWLTNLFSSRFLCYYESKGWACIISFLWFNLHWSPYLVV